MAINDAINLGQLKKSVFNMKNYVDNNINRLYLDQQLLFEKSVQTDSEGNYTLIDDNYIIDPEYDTQLYINFPLNELKTDYFNSKKDKYIFDIYDIADNNTKYSYEGYGYATSKQINCSMKFKEVYMMISLQLNKKIVKNEDNTISTVDDNDYGIVNFSFFKKNNSVDIIFKVNIVKYNDKNISSFDLVPGENPYTIQTNKLEEGEVTGEASINFSNKGCGSHSYTQGNNNEADVASSYYSIIGNSNILNGVYDFNILGSANKIDNGTSVRYNGTRNGQIIGNSNNIINMKSYEYGMICGSNNNIDTNNQYADNITIYGNNINVSNSHTFAIGKYGTVPASLMFAICNGTSDTNRKIIFGIERDTGLPVVDSTPTADNHLVNKKYVDDANAEATDEEIDAMLLEVLGGDYSVQS